MKKITLILFFILFTSFQVLFAQIIVRNNLENVSLKWLVSGGKISESELSRTYKGSSIRWDWNSHKSYLEIKGFPKDIVKENKRSGAIFWVYNDKPVKDSLHIVVFQNNDNYYSFTFGLNFKGWRTAWVMFHRDMRVIGNPQEINDVKIFCPKSIDKGTLFLQQFRIIKEMDPRSPMQDYQLPFVNRGVEKAANAHWSALYVFSKFANDKYNCEKITPKIKNDIDTIGSRVKKILLQQSYKYKKINITDLRKDYDYWKIAEKNGVYTGLAIYTMNDREIMPSDSLPSKKIKEYTSLMFKIALKYQEADNVDKPELKRMFLSMLNFMDYQGWAYGSGLGALHHLGYNFRDFYSSCFLMQKEIKAAGCLSKADSAMYWFSGFGRVFQKKEDLPHSNIDVFNTLINGMLMTALMSPDELMKATRIKAFSEWFSANLLPSYSIRGTLKVDGSIVHHGNLYPAYGVGGVTGISEIVYDLHGTSFQINDDAYNCFKKVLMTMHYYTNPIHWPISVSGRHPSGKWKIVPMPYLYAALSGKNGLDKDLASAYMIIKENPKDKMTLYFRHLGVIPKIPHGHWNINYGLLDIHRRQNWLMTVRGHNRYFIANESYPHYNMFGRYISYGHLEVLYDEVASGIPSNFSDNGWNWNLMPGTTTLNLPLDKLRENILNVDDYSGVEEMLISEELFAGGVNLDNQGLFSMKLRGHDKYNMGDFKAIKSYFMFDNFIICLGSNISNLNKDYCTETTLFQNYLGDKLDTNKVYADVNGKMISNKKEINNWKQKSVVVLDNRKIGYIVPNSNGVEFAIKEQFSRDHHDLKDTKGFFETLTINHGKAPLDSSYEYMMFINTDEKHLCQVVKEVNAGQIYKVEQQDSIAHRLKYYPLGMSAMAVFKSNHEISDTLVNKVGRPSLIMYRKASDSSYIMSITDPDLAFYKGEEDSPRINGKRKEVSIYSKSWFGKPSQPSVVKVTLNGTWEVSDNDALKLEHIEYLNNKTNLYVHCKYGLATKLAISKK